MRESLRSARAAVVKDSGSLDPGLVPLLLQDWGTLLAKRVGTVVGNSIMNRVLAQRGISLRDAGPDDLAPLLDGLVETASVFLSKEESASFASALAGSVREKMHREPR